MKKCKPSPYAVVNYERGRLEYGFRCSPHQVVASRRFFSREELKEAIREHRKRFAKKKK